MIGSETVTAKEIQMFERRAAAVLGLLFLAGSAFAGEGMWTFDNPPTRVLQDKFGFTPSPEWLDRLRLASVRFNDGGSGSFVSGEGLMITNHHVGLACIQNVSTAEHDYVKDGFYAKTRDQEIACPGYEVNVLMKIEDVTSRVLGAVKPAMTDKEAGDARKAATATIENECNQRTGLRCDVVKLYQGGEYHLYHYKKYTDVRLVFAPEQGIAFFGGDPDNFTFPRHDLDICLFRAYENGQPVKPTSYLRWSAKGVSDGDLVFVAGNPGSTSRLDTMAELEIGARRHAAGEPPVDRRAGSPSCGPIPRRVPRTTRRAKANTFSLENAKKALDGRLAALQDPKAMAQKAAEEKHAPRPGGRRSGPGQEHGRGLGRDRGRAQEGGRPREGDALRRVRRRQASRLRGRRSCESWRKCKSPTGCASRSYIDSSLPSLKNRLFSKAPIFDDLEETTLADQLELAATTLGATHPFVQTVLGGLSPAEVAKALVSGTKLKDAAVRQALVDGGAAAVAASTDPMIVVARQIDPLESRHPQVLRGRGRRPRSRASSEKIAQARWKVYGKTVSPDATFTLRLVLRNREGLSRGGDRGRRPAPPSTASSTARSRTAGKAPWDLPPRWLDKRQGLDLATPLELRFHERHHRGQLGQSGGEPGGRARGRHLRRQHAEPGLGLLLHRGGGPLGLRRFPRHHRGPAQGLRGRRPRQGDPRFLSA